MTKKKFDVKYDKLNNWYWTEVAKIENKLKKEGKQLGLDNNKAEYQEIYNEYKNKLKELLDKYNKE